MKLFHRKLYFVLLSTSLLSLSFSFNCLEANAQERDVGAIFAEALQVGVAEFELLQILNEILAELDADIANKSTIKRQDNSEQLRLGQELGESISSESK